MQLTPHAAIPFGVHGDELVPQQGVGRRALIRVGVEAALDERLALDRQRLGDGRVHFEHAHAVHGCLGVS